MTIIFPAEFHCTSPIVLYSFIPKKQTMSTLNEWWRWWTDDHHPPSPRPLNYYMLGSMHRLQCSTKVGNIGFKPTFAFCGNVGFQLTHLKPTLHCPLPAHATHNHNGLFLIRRLHRLTVVGKMVYNGLLS